MEKYAKLFTKASLIYLVLGVIIAVAMAVNPVLGPRLRFVHIHFNLLGFMTMFMAGVAYHVLPRFNARPVPWPDGVKYHFILHNVGLIGMCAAQVAGGLTDDGLPHILFVLFSFIGAAGLFIMVGNLYMVLRPVDEEENSSSKKP